MLLGLDLITSGLSGEKSNTQKGFNFIGDSLGMSSGRRFGSGGSIPSFSGGFDLAALGYLFGGSGYVGGKLSKDKDLGYAGAGATGFGLGALGGLALMLMGGTKVSDTQKLQGIISFGLLNSLVSMGTYGAMSNNMLGSGSLLFGSGGLLPSYKLGDFPIPDAFTMGSIGVGAGVGALLGAVLGKDDETLLPMLMLTGILGGGVLGNFFGQRRGQGFDLFGNLLPRHGKIRSRINYGSGGFIPSFQAGGIAKGPSHESGMVGYSRSGGPFMFEGGEYIIRKSSVDKLGVGTLDALNNGMYSMGRGGFLPSFDNGTDMGGIPIQAGMFARRDLFGIKESDDSNEVYVTNYADMSGAGIYGASTVELLAGISLILQSLLVSNFNEEGNYLQLSTIASEQLLVLEMFASRDLEIPDVIVDQQGVEYQAYVMTEKLDENNKIMRDNDGEAIMIRTQELTEKGLEFQKAMTDAGIQPGKLLRIELSLIGKMAELQLKSIFLSMIPRAPDPPSIDDQLFGLAVQGAVEGVGLTGTTAALATLGIYHGRETAEPGKGDLAAGAGIAAMIATTAIMSSPPGWLVAGAAIVSAEVFGKPENYFAEIGIDEQMDLQEPVTGLYDELMNPTDGLLTQPKKFLEAGQSKIENAGDRLLEGADHMNMNSQKLGSAMERAFGLDEGSLQFDMGSGLEDTYASVESLSKIGDRFKELENIVAPNIQAITDGIKYIIEYPAEFFKNIGNSLDELLGGSIGELFSVIFGIPLQIANLFEEVLQQTIGIGLQEFTKNLLALFLGIALFPVTFTMLITGKMGETVDEFLVNFATFTLGIVLFPAALTALASVKMIQAIDDTITNLQNTFLFEMINVPITLAGKIATFVVENFFGEFMGVFDSFLGEILMIPNMLLQETINFVTAFPARLLKMFGVDFGYFELTALKNPFYGNLGGPEYLIDLEIGEKGKGGLVGYENGGATSGGLAVGPSHQSGMLGMTREGTPFLFEGGEYIINKEATNALGTDYLDKLNRMEELTRIKQIESDERAKEEIMMREQERMMASKNTEAFSVSMEDNKKSSIFSMDNPVSSLGVGPDRFKVSIDPAMDLSSITLTQNLFSLDSGGALQKVMAKNSSVKATAGTADLESAKAERASKEATMGKGDFNSFGDLFDNPYSYDLLEIDNPLGDFKTKTEQERRKGRRKNWYNPFEWAWQIYYYTVDVIKTFWQTLGPDKLSIGIKGNLLKLYESSPVLNFGGDVLDRIGISTPSISRRMGGLIYGPSHADGGIIAEMEGGEYVINKNSASELGSSFLGGLNSGGANFASSLVTSSNVSNQLLNKLIQVVEEKDLSVNINNEPAEETPTEDIRLSVDRERAYRGSRTLA